MQALALINTRNDYKKNDITVLTELQCSSKIDSGTTNYFFNIHHNKKSNTLLYLYLNIYATSIYY